MSVLSEAADALVLWLTQEGAQCVLTREARSAVMAPQRTLVGVCGGRTQT